MTQHQAGLGTQLEHQWQEALSRAGFQDEPPDPNFGHRQNLEGRGPIHLRFRCLGHSQGHEWRETLITGPRVEILCCMGFSRHAAMAPVFAAETISYNGQLRVAVMDLEPCCDVRQAEETLPWWKALMGELQQLHPQVRSRVQSQETWPDWAHHCFSPAVVYCRPQIGSLDLTRDLMDLGKDYLETWLRWISKEPGPDDGLIGSLDWTGYRNHHAAHTPGRPFLSAQFGREWTEEFLCCQMYGETRSETSV